MSFGYSVGDVIAGANLTYRLIRAMSDTKGASTEYIEAMTELSGIQQAFLQVSQIRNHEMLPAATVNAASHIVMSSIKVIADFLEKTKKYQRRLSDPSSKSFQSSWYKVGWTLYKSHELRALRDSLHSRLASIQMLLSAAQYCTPLPNSLKQYQVDSQSSEKATLQTLASGINVASPQTSNDDHDAGRNYQHDSHSPKVAPDDTALVVRSHPLASTEKGNMIPRSSPTDWAGAMLPFKDAIGRQLMFPFTTCATWQGMSGLIKEAFLHIENLENHVANGRYDLMSSTGQIILPTVWERLITPNESNTMTMWPMDNPPMFPKVNPTFTKRQNGHEGPRSALSEAPGKMRGAPQGTRPPAPRPVRNRTFKSWTQRPPRTPYVSSSSGSDSEANSIVDSSSDSGSDTRHSDTSHSMPMEFKSRIYRKSRWPDSCSDSESVTVRSALSDSGDESEYFST